MAIAEEQIIQQQIENPKGTIGIYELPCGYLDAEGTLHTEVVVREITGAEEDVLASNKIPAARKQNELLIRCTQRIGTIVDRQQIAAAIMDMVVGDRVFLLFAVRRASLGDTYPFREKCPDCNEERLHQIDMSELDVKKTPEPRKRIFDTVLPSGRKVRFHPMNGHDEAKASKIPNRTEPATASIMLRVDELDGKPADMEELQNLGMRDRNFLRDAFEEVEGGVETTIDIECPQCGSEFQRELGGVSDPGFFRPSAILKTSNKKSSG